MIVTGNSVLILPDENFTKIGHLEINTHYNPAKHWAVKGVVVGVPETLCFLGEEIASLQKQQGTARDPIIMQQIQEMNRWSTEANTEMELQVGDEVMFRYIQRLAAVEDNEVLGHDFLFDRAVMLTSYDELYLAIRGDEVIMLNGWIMVEPIEYSEEDMKILGGNFKRYFSNMEKPGIGIVRMLGKPNKGYVDGTPEGPDVKEGMTVLFRHSNATPIEYKSHKTLNEGTYPYYRMQRKDILAYR